jgi:gamma-glutamyl-gamma-aminobutyrate hydrolase PuuD
MNKKITVLINDKLSNSSYLSFLKEIFIVEVIEYSKYNYEHIDLALFTGGEDVNPLYYNESQGNRTQCNPDRDKVEKAMYNAVDKKTFKLGICRGSQLLTVLSGGKLVQHVENHTRAHTIISKYPEHHCKFIITSTHHQMMYPFLMKKENYDIIAYSEYYLSNTYLNGKNEEISIPDDFVEPEIVFYKDSNALCIQGHPEMASCPDDTKNMVKNLILRSLK